MTDKEQPNARPAAGVFMILGVIILWSLLVASFADTVGRWPGWLQLPFYIVAGIVWILPLRPILRWSETGRWRDDPSRS